jgi:hypothetical protein
MEMSRIIGIGSTVLSQLMLLDLLGTHLVGGYLFSGLLKALRFHQFSMYGRRKAQNKAFVDSNVSSLFKAGVRNACYIFLVEPILAVSSCLKGLICAEPF